MCPVGKGKSLRFKEIVRDLNYWGRNVVAWNQLEGQCHVQTEAANGLDSHCALKGVKRR